MKNYGSMQCVECTKHFLRNGPNAKFCPECQLKRVPETKPKPEKPAADLEQQQKQFDLSVNQQLDDHVKEFERVHGELFAQAQKDLAEWDLTHNRGSKIDDQWATNEMKLLWVELLPLMKECIIAIDARYLTLHDCPSDDDLDEWRDAEEIGGRRVFGYWLDALASMLIPFRFPRGSSGDQFATLYLEKTQFYMNSRNDSDFEPKFAKEISNELFLRSKNRHKTAWDTPPVPLPMKMETEQPVEQPTAQTIPTESDHEREIRQLVESVDRTVDKFRSIHEPK
jgi:hypothetical protein